MVGRTNWSLLNAQTHGYMDISNFIQPKSRPFRPPSRMTPSSLFGIQFIPPRKSRKWKNNHSRPFQFVAITLAAIKCIKFVEIPGMPAWRACYRSKWRNIPAVICESEKFRRKNPPRRTCRGPESKYPNGFSFDCAISTVHRNATEQIRGLRSFLHRGGLGIRPEKRLLVHVLNTPRRT